MLCNEGGERGGGVYRNRKPKWGVADNCLGEGASRGVLGAG